MRTSLFRVLGAEARFWGHSFEGVYRAVHNREGVTPKVMHRWPETGKPCAYQSKLMDWS